MNSYFVYILRCADNSCYTGVTNDYQVRLFEHESGLHRTCYTYKRRPVELVYVAEFSEILQAIAWEKQVKGWSRKKKEALIYEQREKLHELSECKNNSHYKNNVKVSS